MALPTTTDPLGSSASGVNYTRLNPFLMYSLSFLEQHSSELSERRIRPFYPAIWSRNRSEEENPSYDMETVSGCSNICVGIYRDDLNVYTDGGQFADRGGFDNFWTEQIVNQPGVEWPFSMYPTTSLVAYLSTEYSSEPFEYPNCSIEQATLVCPSDDLT